MGPNQAHQHWQLLAIADWLLSLRANWQLEIGTRQSL
jgi:hypothetical protein